jgi:hypothetical protein
VTIKKDITGNFVMKELSIEEKAKRYDKAIERAKSVLLNCTIDARNAVEFLYPELKESEDERIRKWIKKELESKYVVDNIVNDVMADKAFAWLERQGENKPDDTVEPKFKVGDWVIAGKDKAKQVTNVELIVADEYGYTLEDETYFTGSWADSYRLWTIQDAKAGNILVDCYNNVCIFKNGDNDIWQSLGYLGSYSNEFVCNGFHSSCSCHPATKEQRDLLFQKMNEAGYEWDDEKKELIKIEQKPAEWSAEIEAAISLLKHIAEEQEKDYCPHNANALRKAAQYLESIRPQTTWKPSDGQMKAIGHICDGNYNVDLDILDSIYRDFKKLREE